jgi:hypothetical protein
MFLLAGADPSAQLGHRLQRRSRLSLTNSMRTQVVEIARQPVNAVHHYRVALAVPRMLRDFSDQDDNVFDFSHFIVTVW